jgi:hypothetical protein
MRKVAISLAVVLCSGLAAAQGRGGGGHVPQGGRLSRGRGRVPGHRSLGDSEMRKRHTKDDKGTLAHFLTRTTPEGWKRSSGMVRLNGLVLTSEAKPILKYLVTNHGLAPEEAAGDVHARASHRDIDSMKLCGPPVRIATSRSVAFMASHEKNGLPLTTCIPLYQQAESAFRGSNNGGGGQHFAVGSAPLRRWCPPLIKPGFPCQELRLHTPEWAAWRTRCARLNLRDAGWFLLTF